MQTPKVLIPGGGLAAVRKTKGFTQRDLAAATGVAPSTIAHIEKGSRGVSVETAERIAAALNVSLSSFAVVEDVA